MHINDLIEKYGINYNTVRHIIVQYTDSGRTDVRNFKRNIKHKNLLAAAVNVNDSDIEEQLEKDKDVEVFEEEKVPDDAQAYWIQNKPFRKMMKSMDPINYD